MEYLNRDKYSTLTGPRLLGSIVMYRNASFLACGGEKQIWILLVLIGYEDLKQQVLPRQFCVLKAGMVLHLGIAIASWEDLELLKLRLLPIWRNIPV